MILNRIPKVFQLFDLLILEVQQTHFNDFINGLLVLFQFTQSPRVNFCLLKSFNILFPNLWLEIFMLRFVRLFLCWKKTASRWSGLFIKLFFKRPEISLSYLLLFHKSLPILDLHSFKRLNDESVKVIERKSLSQCQVMHDAHKQLLSSKTRRHSYF